MSPPLYPHSEGKSSRKTKIGQKSPRFSPSGENREPWMTIPTPYGEDYFTTVLLTIPTPGIMPKPLPIKHFSTFETAGMYSLLFTVTV